MIERTNNLYPFHIRRFPFCTAIVLVVSVFLCSIYANLAYCVTNRSNFEYFPPFQSKLNADWNHHLGGEYFNIAWSLYTGQGYANPFTNLESGPTAWMPPIYCGLLAGLLFVFDGNRNGVMLVVILLQVFALIVSGFLVLALARRTSSRVWTGVVLGVFLFCRPVRFSRLVPIHSRLLAGSFDSRLIDCRIVLPEAAARLANGQSLGDVRRFLRPHQSTDRLDLGHLLHVDRRPPTKLDFARSIDPDGRGHIGPLGCPQLCRVRRLHSGQAECCL